MDAILHTFGIDWRLLLINALNFGLLLAALTYFLYTPVMNMLEERRARVAQGVKDAENAAARLHEVEASRADTLAQAGREADQVLASARAAGSAKEKELTAQGEASAALILKEAEAQAAELKAEALRESKEEVAKLIVLGVEKAMQGK